VNVNKTLCQQKSGDRQIKSPNSYLYCIPKCCLFEEKTPGQQKDVMEMSGESD
jgi:hypothetical protein